MKKHNKYPSDVLVCELSGDARGVALIGTISTTESAVNSEKVILFTVVIESNTRDAARNLASAARLWTIADLINARSGGTAYGERIHYLTNSLPYVGYNNAALLNASQAMVSGHYKQQGKAVTASLLASDARNVYPSYVIPLGDKHEGVDRSAFISSYSMFARHAFADGLFSTLLCGVRHQTVNTTTTMNKDE